LPEERADQARALLAEAREAFGERLHLELDWHGKRGEAARIRRLLALEREMGIPAVVSGDVHYLDPEDQPLYEVVSCIRTLSRRGEPHPAKRVGGKRHLRSPGEMERAFSSAPQALHNTSALAERLHFRFPPYALRRLPHSGRTSEAEAALLRSVCLQRLPARYPPPPARGRATPGLRTGLDRKAGLPRLLPAGAGPGGGSRPPGHRRLWPRLGRFFHRLLPAGHTWVDPLQEGLLFERFLNPERGEDPPDIDLDIDWDRREELMDYVRARYGAERIVHVGGVATFRLQGALREVGKALGKEKREIDAFQREVRFGQAQSEETRQWLTFSHRLVGLIHHPTTHPCGFVICRRPVRQELPLAITPEGIVTQYDMYALARLGFLKMDFLGSRSLAIVEETLKRVASADSGNPTAAGLCTTDSSSAAAGRLPRVTRAEEIPTDDPATWEMIGRGATLGVFQLESSGLRALLQKFRPRNLSDLAAALSLYRPGPLQGGMMQPFVRRHRGEEPVTYLHPLLQPILGDTYGVVLYQEQVMRIGRQLGGLSLGQADILRKAMGEKDEEAIRGLRPAFLAGAAARGVPEDTTRQVFELLEKFAGYGFNKAHSASYAIVAYRCAWLKRHCPAAFFAVLLGTQMGYYPPFVYTQVARLQGIPVLPPDFNRSGAACTMEVEGGGIRLGLAYLKDLGPAQIEAILRERPAEGFRSLEGFCLRLYPLVDRGALVAMIQGGAMDSLGQNRPTLLASLPRAIRLVRVRDGLFAPPEEDGLPAFLLEPYSPAEEAVLSWRLTDVFLPNPLELHRSSLGPYSPEGAALLGRARPGSTLKAAAILIHYRLEKTKQGERMAFLSLLDLAGQWEAVLFAGEVKRFVRRLRSRGVLLLEGMVVERQGVREFVVQELAPWTPPGEEALGLPEGLSLAELARAMPVRRVRA
jgi:DNA polymerase-3 subunit alpha